MRPWILLPLLLLAGCIHIHQTTGTASKAEIETHLKDQLQCQVLQLHEDGNQHFTGFGVNASGEFTIEVTRQGDTLAFHGVYRTPGNASFSGSSSWDRHADATFGFHSASDSSNNSLGNP